jgi:flagellin FlaB
MSSLKHNDAGFTGLEAAIVLIAFVVVAAVFSYVVLGAGFFTTQKAQQTVHTSVDQASSTLEIVGNVYGTNSAATGASTDVVKFVNFSMALAPGGTPIDFDKVVMVYSNSTQLVTMNQTPGTVPVDVDATGGTGVKWAIVGIQNAPGTPSRLLSQNEQFEISCEIGRAHV